MSWIGFVIVTLLTFVLQSAVAPRLELWGARADWLLVITVFFAMHSSGARAIAAGWLIGLLVDASTIERAGLMSMSYGVCALLVFVIRDHVLRFQWISQAIVTGLACGALRLLWFIYRRGVYGAMDGAMSTFATDVLLASLITGVWAPLFHFVLLRFAKPLGVKRPRHIYAGTR